MISYQSVVKILRIPKAESAFVYHILEAMEGVALVSTLNTPPGSSTVDLELKIAPDGLSEMNSLLDEWLRAGKGYELVSTESE